MKFACKCSVGSIYTSLVTPKPEARRYKVRAPAGFLRRRETYKVLSLGAYIKPDSGLHSHSHTPGTLICPVDAVPGHGGRSSAAVHGGEPGEAIAAQQPCEGLPNRVPHAGLAQGGGGRWTKYPCVSLYCIFTLRCMAYICCQMYTSGSTSCCTGSAPCFRRTHLDRSPRPRIWTA